MNQLSDLGVQIVTEKQAHVHVSGHPGRPELIEMYDWVRPEIVVPVHGEARHLAEQARFALGHGVPQAVVQKNGDVIRLAPGGPKKIDEVRVGRLVLDGDVILPADGATINERRRIGYRRADHGSAADRRRRRARRNAADPAVRRSGRGGPRRFHRRCDRCRDARLQPGADEDKLREAVRLAVRRCATLWTGKKPIVEVMLLQVA